MAQSRYEKYYGGGSVLTTEEEAVEEPVETPVAVPVADTAEVGDTPQPVSRRKRYYGNATFKPASDPEAAPMEEPGLIDQLIAGGKEMMARFDAEAALDAAGAHAAHLRGEDYYSKGPTGGTITDMMRDYEGKRDPQKTLDSLQQMIDSYQGRMDEAAKVPFSPATQKFLDENSENSVWEDFKEAPVTIIAELGMRSGANMVPSLAAGMVGGAVAGPAGFAAGMAAGSARVEYAASMVEGLQNEGVDLNSAADIAAAVADDELMARVQKRAATRAVVIGGVDGLTGLAGTKIIGPTGKGIFAREATNLLAQSGIQTAGGAAGEAGAQLATGEELQPRQIAAEAAGELVTVGPDVAGAAISGVREGRANAAAARADSQLDEFDTAEQAARERVEREGGDALDQAEAATEALNAVDGTTEADLLAQQQEEQAALDEELAAAEEEDRLATEAYEATPEGQVDAIEQELLEEHSQAQAKRIARQRAVQRLVDAGVEIEPGTQVEQAILEEQEAQAARDAEAEVTAEEAAQKRETAQKAVQERVDTEQRQPGDEAADAAERERTQETAAQDYARGVQRVEQETTVEENVTGVPDVMAAEQRLAEQVARVEPGEQINPVMRKAFEDAAQSAQTSPVNDLPQPTPAQIEAGNYQKGHVNLSGLDISIENPKGSTRSSQPGAARQWSQEMAHHYGYIRKTTGKDGDQIDTFIGEDLDSPNVYVIDQLDQATGNFDEHKVMFGFKSPAAARRGYLASYEQGWKSGPVTQMTMPEFKAWLKESDTTQPANTATPVATVATETDVTPVRARQGGDGIKVIPNKEAVKILEEAYYGGKNRENPNARFVDNSKGNDYVLIPDYPINEVTTEWENRAEGIVDATVDVQKGRDLVNATDLPPIKLGRMGAVSDGGHRVYAAVQRGDTTIPAMVRKDWYDSGPIARRRATTVDTQAEVNRIQTALPNIKANVVATVNDLPANLATEAVRREGVRALYDVANDQVYVVADQHTSPEEVEKTMLHEGVAHKGLRYVMNPGELANMLDSVAKTTNLSDIAAKYKLDLSDPAQAREAAEEYVAEMAETGVDQRLFQKIVSAIRNALRKAGMVGTWSDNDITALLREAHKEMQGTPAQRTMLQMEAEIAETGETVTIEQPADVAIRQLDKRVGVIEQLRTCIG